MAQPVVKSIVDIYNDKLIAMKTGPGNATNFVDKYVTDDGKSANYETTKSAADDDIANTKAAILFYKENLRTLSEQSTTAPTDEDLVTKYIDVMANFHYLRMAMTIFILLQQKKIETESAAAQSKEALTNALTTLTNLIPDGSKGNNDLDAVKDYITKLQKEKDDLGELIRTSIPIVAEIDSTAFPAAITK